MSQHIQSVTVNEHGIVSNPTVVQTLEAVNAANIINAHGDATVEFATLQYPDKQEIILDNMIASGTDQLHYLASVASMDPGHLTTNADTAETVITTEVVQSPNEEQTFHVSLPAPNFPATRYHIKTVKVLKRTKEEVADGKKTYQCSGCDKESNFTSNLYKHMKTQHTDCVVEKLVVQEKRSLLNASYVDNDNPSTNIMFFKCSICKKIFESVDEMKDHLKTHEDGTSPKTSFEGVESDTEFSHDIDKSNADFGRDIDRSNTVYAVKQGRGGINAGKQLYSCSACGKASDSTGNLYRHMQSNHPDLTIERIVNPRTSGENSIISTVKYEYDSGKRHLMNKRARSPNSCEPIVKIVKSTQEQIERGMNYYSCSQCGKESNFTSNLYKHMEACHPYHHIERLIKYQRSRGTVEPVELNTFKSADCHKIVFVIKSTTEEICNGEKAYRCSECGKGSEFTSNLYAHMDKTHSDCVVQTIQKKGNQRSVQDPASLVSGSNTVSVVNIPPDHLGKKYKCSRCYLTTTSTGSLYKHMRRMHKGFIIIKKQQGARDKPLKAPKRKYQKRQSHGDFFDDYDYDYKVDEDDIPTVAENIIFDSFECCLCSDLLSFKTMEELDVHILTDHANENNKIDRSFEHENGDEMLSDEEISQEESQSGANNDSIIEESTSFSPEGIRRSSRRRKAKSVWVIKNSKEARRRGRYPYECSECGKGCTFTSNLYKHMKTNHIGYEIMRITDAGCQKSPPPSPVPKNSPIKAMASSAEPGIVKVIKSSPEDIKNGIKAYKCSLCSKMSDFTSNLYTHMKSAHKDHTIKRIINAPKHKYISIDNQTADN